VGATHAHTYSMLTSEKLYVYTDPRDVGMDKYCNTTDNMDELFPTVTNLPPLNEIDAFLSHFGELRFVFSGNYICI
jgi:hypothetical protein